MVIGLVIVTAPNPPGSRTLISPAGAVFEIAPANVLQGAVRLHGLASLPTPETQVRVACAETIDEVNRHTPANRIVLFMTLALRVGEAVGCPGGGSGAPGRRMSPA